MMSNGQVVGLVIIAIAIGIGLGIGLGALAFGDNHSLVVEEGEPKVRTKDIRHSYTVEVRSTPTYRGYTAGMEYQLLFLDQDRVGAVMTYYDATTSYTPKFHKGEILILTTNGYGTVVSLRLKI